MHHQAVHYALCEEDIIFICGIEAVAALGNYTDAPSSVRGCKPCLDAAAEDLADVDGEHSRSCRYCGREITVIGGVQWRRAIHAPCPHCRRKGW